MVYGLWFGVEGLGVGPHAPVLLEVQPYVLHLDTVARVCYLLLTINC